MKAIKVDLPKELKRIKLHVFADLHIGDKFCDLADIKRRIEEVKQDEESFCVLNGDIINNATKTSVSDCYAEELSPMEQIQTFVDLFSPIKDKILAVTSGNHENRTYNKEGIDITDVCCRQLGIEQKYSRASAIIFVRFGELSSHNHNNKVLYTISMIHGSGGGRKEGAKAIRLADMASIVDTDIYIHSHTHLPMIMKQGFVRVDTKSSTFANVTKLFVNTAASLDYGGYGEAFEFKPSTKETPVIYLNGMKKEFTAKL